MIAGAGAAMTGAAGTMSEGALGTINDGAVGARMIPGAAFWPNGAPGMMMTGACLGAFAGAAAATPAWARMITKGRIRRGSNRLMTSV